MCPAPLHPAVTVSLRRTPDGRRLVVDRPVEASADRAWDLLRDTDRWPEWGPSVAAVDSPTQYVEEGTGGRVKVAGVGVWVPFRVTTCADYRWTWRVARVPATGHRVVATGDDRCRVAFEVPPLAAGYVPVCRRGLSRLAALAEDGDRRVG